MKRGHFTRSQGGFTLLELTLALSLLALMALAMAGALRLGERALNSGSARMESLERFRATFRILCSQIQSYTPLNRRASEEAAAEFLFRGDGENLQVPTGYSLWSGRKACVVVSYRVESGENGKKAIHAEERDIFTRQRRTAKLIGGLDEIVFDYYGKSGIREESEWTSAWNADMNPPEEVRIRLACRGNRHVFVIPCPARKNPFEAFQRQSTPYDGTDAAR